MPPLATSQLLASALPMTSRYLSGHTWNHNCPALGKSPGALLCRSSFLVSWTQGWFGEHRVTFQRECTSHLAQYAVSPSPRTPCSLGWTDDTAPGHPFSFLGACPALLLSQQPGLSLMAVFIHLPTRLPTKAMNFLGATLGARVPAPSSQHLVRTCPLLCPTVPTPNPHQAHRKIQTGQWRG